MATNITSAGLFRDGYRIRVGEGSQEADPAKRTRNLDETALSDLIQRAKLKWPGANFELRVIEKRSGTYLEVLRQKASTLAKDAKPKNRYTDQAADAPLQERDKRRMQAAKLMEEKGWLRSDGAMLYRAQDPQVAITHFARHAERGAHARELFEVVDRQLEAHWQEKLASLGQASAQAQPPAGPQVNQQHQQPIAQQAVYDDPFADFEPPLGGAPADPARNQQLEQSAQSLKRAAAEGANRLNTWAESAKVPSDLAAARKVALSGLRGESALRVDRTLGGERATRYYDWSGIKRFNRGPAYAPPAMDDAATRALAAASLKPMSELRGALREAESSVRKANQASPDQCWTTSALKDALLASARPSLDRLAAQQANIEQGVVLPNQNPSLAMARTAAQTLLAQLIVLEHLGAVTYDPESRQALVEQHDTQSKALLDHLRGTCTPDQLRAVEQHLKNCRSAFVARAEQSDLEKFPSAAAARRLDKLDGKVKAAMERLKEMPSEAQYRKAIDDTGRLILARAELRQERSRAQELDGTALKATGRLRNTLHQTKAPPANLSRHPDWQLLCDFVNVVNTLRQEGREGFPGYGLDERIPDEVVASQFKVNQFYEPFVATKIISEARKLMESEERPGAQRPIRVYIPSGRAGEAGEWQTWSADADHGVMSDRTLRVKVAQMIELEFLIAHNPTVDQGAIEQLESMHRQFADQLLVASGDQAEQAGEALREWVQGSRDRVAKLVNDFKKEQRQLDPEFFDTIQRARDLKDEATQLQRDQANERVLRLRADQQEVAQAELELAYPPHNVDEAIEWLFNADEHYTKRAAANAYLMRQFTGLKTDAATREAIAEKLASRIAAAGPSAKVPAALRMLAAASTGGAAATVREAVSRDVRKALQAQGVVLDIGESETPAKLLDYGRLVYREELKAQLDDEVDGTRLALTDLVRPGDTPADAANAELMGERFREAAQAHFDQPGETRPFASVLLVNDNHWVSLVATKNAQGAVSCIAVDTNTDQPPAWFEAVKRGMSSVGALDGDGQQPIPVTFVGASLQEGRAPNACGVLQSSLLRSLQQRDASVDAQAHVRDWIKTGGLSPDNAIARWQVRAERAQMMQSALEAGLSIAENDSLAADRLLRQLDDVTSYQFQQLDQHLEKGGSPNDPAYAAHLGIISESLSTARQLMGALKLFDAQGDLAGAPSSMQLDQSDVLLQLYKLKAGAQSAGDALSSIQTAYANVVRRGNPDERRIMESLIAELKRSEGIELLAPEQVDAERAAVRKQSQASSPSSRETLAKLADDLLPGWAEFPKEWGSPWRDYLQRFPQRGAALALLADATEQLGQSEGASEEGLAHQHEAFVIWSALADSPTADLHPGLRERAVVGCERTKPSPEIQPDPANEGDLAVDYSPEEATRLRRELDQSMNEFCQQFGVPYPIRPIVDEGEPVVEDGLDEDEVEQLQLGRERDRAFVVGAGQDAPAVKAEVKAAQSKFRSASRVWADPKSAQDAGIPNLEKWATARDAELCQSLFGDSGSKKFFSTGNTLGSYKALPPLQVRADDLETIYRLGELMVIQMIRKDKSERARDVFQTYLQPLIPYGNDGPASPSLSALKAIESLHLKGLENQPEPQEPFEKPTIRRGVDKDTLLIPSSSKRK